MYLTLAIITGIFATVLSIILLKYPRCLHTLNIAELIPDALLIVDTHGNILKANTNAEIMFGYTKSELYNDLVIEDLMPERLRKHHAKIREHFVSSENMQPMGLGRDLLILTKDGREIPTEIALSPTSQGWVSRLCKQKIIVLLHDISLRKNYENTIKKLAYYDTLTELPNRTSFYNDVQGILNSARDADHTIAFVILDIRELKKINDTLGHYVGDDVIQRTGEILKSCIKEYNTECTVKIHLYSISGNEFAFLLECTQKGFTCADDFATYLINIFKAPAMVKGQDLDMHINVNMGVSMFPVHGVTISQLLKTSDIALINSKQQGMNCYSFYNNVLNTEFHNFITYENAIKYFIDTRDFNVAYQPVWSMKENKYIGSEVLFRCNEEKYQNMDVEFLINVAESTGLIVPLGNAILERACEEIKEYDLTCNELVVSVNASIQQFEDSDFIDTFCDIVKKSGLDPNNSKLAIEITETTLMNREANAIDKVNELRKHNILIYIDDFGKGFSSLSYLQKIPADKLKIDMGFLENVETDKSGKEILRGIIALGHAIGMTVCTEGVETKKQFELLTELGCDEIQGFYKGVPISAPELKELYSGLYPQCCVNPDIIEHQPLTLE